MKQKYKIGQKVRIKIYDTEGVINDISCGYYCIDKDGAYLENELEPINEFSIKQLYKPLLAIFILVMIYLALKGCDKPNSIQNNTDKIKDAKKSEQIAGIDYKVKLKKLDKVKDLIPEYKDRWHTKYDTIYREAPDTCHYYLSKLNAEKMASDSINDIVVKTYSDVITAGAVYLAKKDSVILKQDVALKSKDAVIDSLTRSKKKYFKGLKHGIIIGAIITQGLNTGSQFIK